MMARRRSKNLSEREKKILEVLEEFQDDYGYPPSIREICDKTNISSTSVVNYYLEQLSKLGYIERDGHVSRGIRLLKPLSQAAASVGASTTALAQTAHDIGRTLGDLLKIPMVGRIFASTPVPLPASDFAYFDDESTMIEVAQSVLPSGNRQLYALEVQGDSMIDAMVNDGDIVVMEKATEARNGEMVAVWLNDREETTLKYFYNEGGRVRLQPANPTMKPIYIDNPKTVEIQGKVVLVLRQLGGKIL